MSDQTLAPPTEALAPGVAEFVDRFNRVLPPDFYTRPVDEQRRLYARLHEAEFRFPYPDGVELVDDVVDSAQGSARVRVHRPAERVDDATVLYMHGGGFVLGTIDTHDSIVAEMAATTGLTTVSVDFSPAPEQPFPRAVEECFAALCGVVEHARRLEIDPRRIAVAGDSSGGNLAVVLCLAARDRNGPRPRAQVLVSPVLDFARWRGGGEDAPLLSGDEMEFFTRCYVGGDMDAVEHPYVSPLRTARFHDLPPAYVMAAEWDSLRTDAIDYARALRAHGTPVELVLEPGFVHACLRARALSPSVAEAFDRLCAATSRLLGAPSPAPARAPAGR
ncbi:MAG TPA: alpha/beta hydrolase [Actinomycetota bacterium]|nr:alpha/beta hydrolase [Actinomycetota bacterium]